MPSKFTLPLIDRLSVSNYALYPGPDGSGIDLEFPSGVKVLAGINGVGKTTMLNLLIRMILGPLERKRSDKELSRSGARILVEDRKAFSFFQDRVPKKMDDTSTATLEFRLGRHQVKVTRLMRSMALKEIKINGKRKTFTEAQCILELARLAGFRTDYDFYVVVRYLQFFTEERLEIMWSTGTQFEFFKMLFLDEENAVAIDKLFAEIQRVDTDYRNRRFQLAERKKLLDEQSQPASQDQTDAKELETRAAKALEDYEASDAEYSSCKDECQKTKDDLRNREIELDRAEALLGNAEDDLERLDAGYISQALPGLSNKLQLLMHGFGSGQGCFMCGTKDRKLATQIGKELNSGHCFVCHSPVKRSAKSAASASDLAALKEGEAKIATLRRAMDNIRSKISAASDANSAAIDALAKQAVKRDEAFRALRTAQAMLPKKPAATTDTALEIEAEERALEALDSKRKKKVAAYREEVVKARAAMEDVKEGVSAGLTRYAQAFLQEDIEVAFNASKDQITLATGAGRVGVPTFSINMSSSTHAVPSQRISKDSVSESQKEFLDLAFRMALLDMISRDGSAMLVMETPEASLDSFFVRRAGILMRQFATANAEPQRKLIVTSNLNGTEMIPALLGLVDEDGTRRKLAADDKSRLVNLLEITPSAKVMKNLAAKQLFNSELRKITNA